MCFQTYCDMCDKNLENRMDLIMHMESTHRVRINDPRIHNSADSNGLNSDLANILTQQTSILAKLLDCTRKTKSIPETT